MDSCLTVLEPVVEPVAGTALTAPRPERLDGLVLGVLDNGKPNSDRFLAVLAARLQEDHDLAGVVVERKPSIGKLAPDALVDALAGRCDLILTGVGDCAGCCSCSTHDGIAFERRGIPAAVVCTTEFVAAARTAASAAGLASYPLVVIDHPLGSASPDQLDRRAARALSQVEATLLEGGACAC